jgi:ATP-dependent DNA helicase PIF1
MILDEYQNKVIETLKNGKNVIMAAKAGSGKSFLIKQLPAFFKEKRVAITSTTGISALGIEGVTIHSFMGVGLGKKSKDILLSEIQRYRNVKKRILCLDILVVDEISMMTSDLLEKIEYILRKIRSSKQPFGGVRLLFSGDFLQLEPIEGENILNHELISDFVFINLQNNYRQQGDTRFQELLNNLRVNELTEEDLELIKTRIVEDIPESVPRMYCTNKEVALANKGYSGSLASPEVLYNAKFSGTNMSFVNQLKTQFNAKGIDALKLKNGMRVMLTRNMPSETGLVNGSTGKIIRCNPNDVLVSFDNGAYENIAPCLWELYDNEVIVAKASQIPLIIGFSISIHKSQGMTLDSAYIDLSKAFCCHQVYVAMSRVKSLDGLYLNSFNNEKVKVNQSVVDFFENLSID